MTYHACEIEEEYKDYKNKIGKLIEKESAKALAVEVDGDSFTYEDGSISIKSDWSMADDMLVIFMETDKYYFVKRPRSAFGYTTVSKNIVEILK